MTRTFTHAWFFFGDSLTLGVNDHRMPGGWVSRLALLGREAKFYTLPPATFYNLSARRQSMADLAQRWRQEVDCRQMPGLVQHFAFCAGVVDMAVPGSPAERIPLCLAPLRSMLQEASSLAATLVISPPPVAEPALRARLAELCAAQAKLCADLGVPFADVHAILADARPYMDDLSDGLHPGPEGCAFMAEVLLAQPQVREFLRTDLTGMADRLAEER